MRRSSSRSAPRVGVGRPFIVVPFLAFLLSACGLIAQFVPPQNIGDPMGVDGTEVTGTMAHGGLSMAEVAHLEATSTFAFGDVFDPSDLPGGFSIASFTVDAGLSDTVRVERLDGLVADLPDSLQVIRGVLEITIEDNDHGPVTFGVDAELDLTYSQVACDATGCDYVLTDAGGAAGVLSVRASGSDADTLVDIVTIDGPDTENRGEIRVGIEVDSDPSLAGSRMTFTLRSDGTTIRIGG